MTNPFSERMSQYYNYFGTIKPEHASGGYYQQPTYPVSYAPVVFATSAVAKPTTYAQPTASNVASTAFINPQVQSVNYGGASVGYATAAPYYAPSATVTKMQPLIPYTTSSQVTAGNSSPQQFDAVLQAYVAKAAFGPTMAENPRASAYGSTAGTMYRTRAHTAVSGQTKNFRKQKATVSSGGGESVFFCDVCMVSCASALTYKDHLQGQPHKKKEAQNSKVITPGGKNFFCEMCNVNCTGYDAYQAHIVGAKHKKRQKLLQQLGKPIPAQSVHSVTARSVLPDNREKAAESILSSTDGGPVPVGESYVKEIYGADGKFLTYECQLCECKFNDAFARNMHLKGRRHRLEYKRKVNPKLEVETKPMSARDKRAQRILEEKKRMFAEQRTMTIQMNEMKKIEMASGFTMCNAPKFRMGPGGKIHPIMVHSVADRIIFSKSHALQMDSDEKKTFQEFMKFCSKVLNTVAQCLDCQLRFRPFKVTEPTEIKNEAAEQEDTAVRKEEGEHPATDDTVGETDVVDGTPDSTVKPSSNTVSGDGDTTETNEATGDEPVQQRSQNALADVCESIGSVLQERDRCLKNIVPAGNYAKKLCVSGDQDTLIVLLAAQWPTLSLVRTLADAIKDTMKVIPHTVECTFQLNDDCTAGQFVSRDSYSFCCHVLLTSPVVREYYLSGKQDAVGSANDVKTGKGSQNIDATAPVSLPLDRLDVKECLYNLALTRRAKWFQALELIVERSLSSAIAPLTVSVALRRIFECVSSGVLLPFGAGLSDPCEKEAPDSLLFLTEQQREEVTSYAQYALRCLAFGKYHLVLDVEPPSAINETGVGGAHLQPIPNANTAASDPAAGTVKVHTSTAVADTTANCRKRRRWSNHDESEKSSKWEKRKS